MPYRDHIGGNPYDGPPRSWWLVTMRADQGMFKFRVYKDSAESAAHSVCAHELAPMHAVVSVHPAKPPRQPSRYLR